MSAKNLISKELAVEEVKKYLSNFIDEEINVEENYKNVLNAVIDGRLVFGDDLVPTYELINPIHTGTEHEVKKVTFKTRVLPTSTASIAKGIDLKTDAIRYSLAVTAHIVGFSTIQELDRLSKKDYNLIQELSIVFL